MKRSFKEWMKTKITNIVAALFLGLTLPRLSFADKFIFDGDNAFADLGFPTESVDSVFFDFLSYLLGFFGLVSLIMFLVGGFMYLSAAGSTERVEKAKNLIRNAVIGMAVVILSYTVVLFFYEAVLTFTQAPAPTPPAP